ncbi:MAG: serine hydrolase [Bacteroidetes bacterium]|nr:serine hydrolase [Bacteroidota bacterium]
MRKPFLAALYIAAFVSLSYGQVADKRFTGLDTTFKRILKDWKAVGFAVAVVEKNKIVYSSGTGFRDLEKKLPVTPNTLFAIGSCTKAFTSSLIGLLQKDNKLEYDKPVRDYLPELKFYNDALNDQVTIRDMMCHRTGLPRHDYSWYLFPTTRDSLIYRIRYMEPTAGIREKWQYNNFMFLAQGVLAEKLYGKKWEELVKQKFFDSLGMKTSNFSITDMEKSSDAAKGYYVRKDSLITAMDYYNIDAMGPAGAINSSVNEMANWVITWINGGKFNGKEVLPAPYVSEAMSSQMVSASGLSDKENPDIYLSTYGFGWSISSYRGHYRVQHGGNIDGFSAMTCFFPSDSIGIIVLSNQNGSTVPAIVRNILSDRMLNLTRKDWNGNLLKEDSKAKAEAKEAEKNRTAPSKIEGALTHSLKDYEGLYSNPGYGTIDIYLKNDSLFANLKNNRYWFKHAYYDIFNVYDVNKKLGIDTTEDNTPFQFQMNRAGEISSVDIELQPGLKPIQFTKTPKAVMVAANELQRYVGEYELPGVTVKVYLKNNVLFVFVPGQPEYETIAVGNHEFKLKALAGFSVKFDINDKGDVTGVNFIQPNGTFKAKRK